jgi:hypothetical protein
MVFELRGRMLVLRSSLESIGEVERNAEMEETEGSGGLGDVVLPA